MNYVIDVLAGYGLGSLIFTIAVLVGWLRTRHAPKLPNNVTRMPRTSRIRHRVGGYRVWSYDPPDSTNVFVWRWCESAAEAELCAKGMLGGEAWSPVATVLHYDRYFSWDGDPVNPLTGGQHL